MRRRILAISVSLAALASIVFAGSSGLPQLTVSQPNEQTERPKVSAAARRSYVDMKSDEGWQMEHNGRKIMVVIGNFAAHHNGAVITADSAVRYSERHIECFGKVLIKKGSTYVYGDRAEYNGGTNEANVYAPIVKVVDGDATLYTYNFKFNTKTNIGSYTDGGVLINGDNMLESERGYVYTKTHDVICVDNVQMRNDTYEMTADSVVYNTETEYAKFYKNTNIWDIKEGDYLYADRGAFDKSEQLYLLTRNGYILTKEQELMCDTLNYYREKGYVRLMNNIQVDDIKNKILLFGDWGEYWRETGNVFVTRNPSTISYDTSQGDTVYMRSDSMYLNTRYPMREKIEQARKDSIAAVQKRVADSLAKIEASKPKSAAKSSAGDRDKGARRQTKGAKDMKGAKKQPVTTQTTTPTTPAPTAAMTSATTSPVAAATAPQTSVAPMTVPAAKGAESSAVSAVPAASTMGGNAEVGATSKGEMTAADAQRADSLQAQAEKTTKAVKEAMRKEKQEQAAKRKQDAQKAKMAERSRIDSIRAAERAVADSIRAAERAIADSIRAEKRAVADSLQAIKDEQRRKEYIAVTTARLAELERRHRELDSLQREKDRADSIALAKADSIARAKDTTKVASAAPIVENAIPQTETLTSAADSLKIDSLKIDSLQIDSLKVEKPLSWSDTMTIKEQKSLYKERLKEWKERVAKIKADTLNALLDRIGAARQAKRTAMYRRWERQDSIFNARAVARADRRLIRKLARRERRGIYITMVDSTILRQIDSLLQAEGKLQDSLVIRKLDSIIEIYFPRPIPTESKEVATDSMHIDSMYREVLAFRRVKVFRSDFQTVCDSLATTNIDSVIHLYKSPVMWNGDNQITADEMHITTFNNQLVRADFGGKPITASQIDTAHYNQVTGKEMVSYFRDNKIYRNDVHGNVQTIYYMQEDNSPEITLMAYIEAGDMSAYFENQEVVGITYRGNPTYTFYPMDKIPETQPTRLEGFKWEADRRPTKDSVFNRTIRPSMREAKEALRRPHFPQNALLQQRRDDYMRRRMWRDRKDTLSVATIEWVRSVNPNF